MPFGSGLPSPPSIFPLYLLPSIPFRRRSSADTTISASSTESTVPAAPVPTPPSYLNGDRSHLRCSRCLTDLCLTSQIISKGFTGRHGRAYLVAPPSLPPGEALNSRAAGNLPNTHIHKPVPRQLVTGGHTVSDISCAQCGSVLGWKYVAAEESSQRYKVGKFILETKRVCKAVCWENDASNNNREERDSTAAHDDNIEFDSQDEDECEDLFAGVWSPQLARKRRRNRAAMDTNVDDDTL